MKPHYPAMTLTLLLAAALLLFRAPSAVFAEDAPAVGRVSALAGKVTITAGMKPGPVRLFDAVHGKDRLDVPKDASVRIIFYSDTHEEMLKGPCTAGLTEKGASITGNGRDCLVITRKPPAITVAANPSKRGRSIAAIAVRGGVPVPQGNFMEATATPTFTWNEVSSAGFYEFILFETSGDSPRKVIDGVVSEPRFTVPAAKRLTFGGHYEIELKAYIDDPREPANKGLASNEIAPDQDGAAALSPFTLPSREVVDFISREEAALKSLAKGSPQWRSAAPYLMFLYLEYGLTGKAGALAHDLCEYEKDSELLRSIEKRYH